MSRPFRPRGLASKAGRKVRPERSAQQLGRAGLRQDGNVPCLGVFLLAERLQMFFVFSSWQADLSGRAGLRQLCAYIYIAPRDNFIDTGLHGAWLL